MVGDSRRRPDRNHRAAEAPVRGRSAPNVIFDVERPLGDPQGMRLECRGIDLPASDPRGRTASPIDTEGFFVELDHLITGARHVIRFASILRALRGSIAPPFCAGGHLLGGAPSASDICRSTQAALAPVRVLLSRQIFLPRFSRQLQVRNIVDQIEHGLASANGSINA